MNCAMMAPAQRDGEFVACLPPERTGLHVAKMMRVGRLAAADETRLLSDIA
jgi:hypothetical protein